MMNKENRERFMRGYTYGECGNKLRNDVKYDPLFIAGYESYQQNERSAVRPR